MPPGASATKQTRSPGAPVRWRVARTVVDRVMEMGFSRADLEAYYYFLSPGALRGLWPVYYATAVAAERLFPPPERLFFVPLDESL